MEAQELRLCNWVQFFGIKAKVEVLDKDFNNLGFEPIELTEEILLKCGVAKKSEDLENDNIDYLLNNSDYWIQYHKEVNNFLFYSLENSLGINLTSLHQLQNLYFALTNKELEINL